MLWLAPLLLAVGAMADCDDLSGEWRNAKGSVLKIQQDRHQLHGTFTTTVEVKEGSAGKGDGLSLIASRGANWHR